MSRTRRNFSAELKTNILRKADPTPLKEAREAYRKILLF